MKVTNESDKRASLQLITMLSIVLRKNISEANPIFMTVTCAYIALTKLHTETHPAEF